MGEPIKAHPFLVSTSISFPKKEVSPMHGYYPNGGKSRAKKLGYRFHGQDD